MVESVTVEEVIESKLHQIDQQMDALREERARLERALHALGTGSRNGGQSATASARRGDAEASRRRRPRRAGKTGRRAPRGSNVAAILSYVEAHPGATTSQISGGTGIAKTVVYSAVARLSSAGRLRREPLPDGQVAYHVGQTAD